MADMFRYSREPVYGVMLIWHRGSMAAGRVLTSRLFRLTNSWTRSNPSKFREFQHRRDSQDLA